MKELRIAVAIEALSPKAVTPIYSAEAILGSCANLLAETDGFVRPIHYSVREFFTSPSQREIDNIHSHLILGVDPREAAFIHPSEIECDYIRKKICFETDQCEAKIAIACVSYLTSKDVLANLADGPRHYWFRLERRIETNELLRYCSTHFDKHTRNVQEPTMNILNVLDNFLSIDTKALAAILQVRSVRKDFYNMPSSDYRQVDAMAMIYSTELFNLPYMRKTKWMQQQAYESLLHYVATGGLLDAIEHLIKTGLSVNAKDENGVMALYYASENGHYNIYQFLLQNWVDINAKGGYFGCALQAASIEGHENIFQLLLAKDADVNLTGGKYGCALQAASWYGHEKIVKLLLAKDADVNLPGGKYGCALQAVSWYGHENIVKLLLAKDADVNLPGGKYGCALQAASRYGHENIVKLLLAKDADVNLTGGEYGCALQAASVRGHENIVQLLLAKNADVNLRSEKYGCALQAASEKGHENIVQLLSAKGVVSHRD